MVRGDASRNTVFTSPQGWVGEIVSQVRTGGFLTFEYHVWRDQKSKDNGEPAFLLNNHKAQIRETHQRVRVDANHNVLHRGDGVTPVALALSAVDDFLQNDQRASRYTQTSKEEWVDTSGRKLTPFVFPSYSGIDEALDPQWLRETYVLDENVQRDEYMLAFLERAERNNWSGDKRGTTLNLQVGSGANDGYVYGATGGGTPSVFNSGTGPSIGTLAGANRSYDNFALFSGVSGLSGSTIDSAVLSLKGRAADDGTPLTAIKADDSATPAAPTSAAEFNAVSVTTASVAWDDLNLTTAGFTSSPSIVAVIQELADSYDPSAIQIMHFDTRETNTTNRANVSHYDDASGDAPKLDIDYTAAGGGDPEGSLIRGKLIRGGLLRGGVLVG